MWALTIWEPYATLIALGFKPVENRDWVPPRALMKELIAIHAAKRPMDEDTVYECAKQIDWTFEKLAKLCAENMGKVVGVGRLVEVITDEDAEGNLLDLPDDIEPWFVGKWGWVFREVQALKKPVEVRGLQKLWKLPFVVYEQVQPQLQMTLPTVR